MENEAQVRIGAYVDMLYGGRALFATHHEVTREIWKKYAGNLNLKRSPGIQGFGFSEKVPAAELKKHLDKIRAQGFPSYRIYPETQRDEFHSIIYLEPFRDRNLRAFGYDMFTEPTRRKAMTHALMTGGVGFSGKVALAQETDDKTFQPGFFIYLPVYKEASTPATAQERQRSLLGFVFAPFRMHDLMNQTWQDNKDNIACNIYDGLSMDDANLFFSTEGDHRKPFVFVNDALVKRREINFFNHSWTLVFASKYPHYSIAHHPYEISLLLCGVITSFSLAGITALAASRLRTQAAIKTMSSQLAEEAARYRMLADYTHEWEYWERPDGTLNYVSPACERVTGYTPETFIQNPHLAEEKILPADKSDYSEHKRKIAATIALRRADTVFSAPFRISASDGKTVWIEQVTRIVFDEDDNCLGLRVCNRDVTARKEIEDALLQVVHVTSSHWGENFFKESARLMAKIFKTKYAFITRLEPSDTSSVRCQAFWDGDGFREDVTLDITGSPCDKVLKGRTCFYPSNLQDLFPDDSDLVALGAQSYMGCPVISDDGKMLGHVAVLSTTPMDEQTTREPLMCIFASQVATEIGRLEMERQLQESEQNLRTIFDISSDAILIQADDGRILHANKRSLEMYGVSLEELSKLTVENDLSAPNNPFHRLPEIWRAVLDKNEPQRFDWKARRVSDGHIFDVEVVLQRIGLHGLGKVVLANIRDMTERKQQKQAS